MTPRTADAIDTLPEEAFLLPWYVNGTLDAEDRRRVEAALARSAELREELALLRSVAGAVVESTDAMPEPDADGFARLLARIDAEPVRTPAPRPAAQKVGWAARIGAWFEASWRPAMAAAAVVIAVQATAIVALVDRAPSGEGFVTASGPAAVPAPAARFLVSFSDTATLGEIRTLLETGGMIIVAGPRADGYFVVAAEGDAEAAAAALGSKPDMVTQAERMP